MAKPRHPVVIYLEYWAVLAIRPFIRLLPISIARYIMLVLAKVVFLVDRKHYSRMIQHLMYSGLAQDLNTAKEMARKHIHHLALLGVEMVKMHDVITPDNIRDHITASGDQEAVELFFSGENTSNAIVVTAHLGNWEIAGIGYTLLSGHPLLTIMRPFNNPKLGELVYEQRERYNHRICPKEGALKPLLGALKKKESVCIIADQHASESEGVETVFFGQPARTHASPAMLHLKTGVPILVSVSKRLDENFHFSFVCAPPIRYTPTDDKEGDLQKVAQLYTTAIENLIRDCPEQWMWSHRRWLNFNRKRRNQPQPSEAEAAEASS